MTKPQPLAPLKARVMRKINELRERGVEIGTGVVPTTQTTETGVGEEISQSLRKNGFGKKSTTPRFDPMEAHNDITDRAAQVVDEELTKIAQQAGEGYVEIKNANRVVDEALREKGLTPISRS